MVHRYAFAFVVRYRTTNGSDSLRRPKATMVAIGQTLRQDSCKGINPGDKCVIGIAADVIMPWGADKEERKSCHD
jgi:hypothetical protein